MADRKFFVTRFSITVLSEDTPFTGDVDELAYAISEGDCVGGERYVECEEINSRYMAGKLYELGSEPGFFSLDDDGQDIL